MLLEHITLQLLVKIPFSIEMLGGVLVQSISSHSSLLGCLLDIGGHLLQVLPPGGGHGQHLGHAGPLQVVDLVKCHVDTGEELRLIIERCYYNSCFSAQKPELKLKCGLDIIIVCPLLSATTWNN